MPDKPTKKPTEGELGSAIAHADSLFSDLIDPTLGLSRRFEARDMADMLRTESQARKGEMVLSLPILSAPKRIVGGKGDTGEAEWCQEVLSRPANNGGMSTPLDLVLAQATSAFTYRVASFEKVWISDPDAPDRPGRPGGVPVVFDKLAFRPAVNTSVVRDRKTGAYKGLRQDPPYGSMKPVEISPDRAWTYVHGQHRSPIVGSSDMEIPLACWRSKQKLKFLWFLFLELQARPRMEVYDGREQAGDHQQVKDAAKLVARMPGGGAMAMPPGVRLREVVTSGEAAKLFIEAIKYLDGEMTGQVLAQFTDLAGAAASGSGSYALSRDQSDFFRQTRQSAANEVGTSFDNWVLADLVKHNLGRQAVVPHLQIGPLVTPDVEQMTSLLAAHGQGAVPADFVGFLVESTATALGMPTDKAAAMMKAATKAAEKAAATPAQERLAPVTGPLEAAENIVRKAAQRDPAVRDAATAAAARG